MRTIAANANESKVSASNLGDIVSRRFCPSFFETDFVKIILPLLQEADAGAAGVLDEDGNLCGLLTERAILRHMFARTSDKLVHPANVKKYIDDMVVGDVMIENPECVEDDISIEDAAAQMLKRGYRFMPVVSRQDRRKLLGIVSEGELAHHLKQQLEVLRKTENTHKSLLSYMLCEPYGRGYQPKQIN
ncbi:MAG: CBS domain-containing protein [Micavibrio sp.]|nr:CBS domain-containing protein [Micavibrio sp.]